MRLWQPIFIPFEGYLPSLPFSMGLTNSLWGLLRYLSYSLHITKLMAILNILQFVQRNMSLEFHLSKLSYSFIWNNLLITCYHIELHIKMGSNCLESKNYLVDVGMCRRIFLLLSYCQLKSNKILYLNMDVW